MKTRFAGCAVVLLLSVLAQTLLNRSGRTFVRLILTTCRLLQSRLHTETPDGSRRSSFLNPRPTSPKRILARYPQISWRAYQLLATVLGSTAG